MSTWEDRVSDPRSIESRIDWIVVDNIELGNGV